MEPRPTTIVVDSRLLFRKALEALMRTHSYGVVAGAGCVAEVAAESGVYGTVELVLLGGQSASTAISEVARVRELWPDSKIVLLLEPASSVDLDELLGSEVDACVPLFVSAGTLMNTLDLIATTDARVMIVANTTALSASLGPEAYSTAMEIKSDPQQADESKATTSPPTTMAVAQSAVQDASASKMDVDKTAMPQVAPRRILPELSEREIQILNGLVKGHANKVIARACDITEATVKVHIRSILRKIRVGNRTQAAIWALESGYSVDVSRESH